MSNRSQIRRIAVLRALQLGDLLLAVPALRSLRAGFPEAEITLIGLPWAGWFVRRFHRYVDRLVEFQGFPGIAEVDYNPARAVPGIQALRRDAHDLVIQLHGSGEISNRFIEEIRGPGTQTAGLYRGDRPDFLTCAGTYPTDEHEIARCLAVTRAVGCPDTGASLELPVLPGDDWEAERLLREVALVRPLVGLHAGARDPDRRWPAERFAAVADTLVRQRGARILLTGSLEDSNLVAEVEARMREPAINLAGATSLGGLAALISRLDLFISNDTGPAHMAEALGTPSVVIWGPAEFRRWAPLDRKRHRVVRTNYPIDRIEPADVLAAAEHQLVKESVPS